jgi:hypothetical protein
MGILKKMKNMTDMVNAAPGMVAQAQQMGAQAQQLGAQYQQLAVAQQQAALQAQLAAGGGGAQPGGFAQGGFPQGVFVLGGIPQSGFPQSGFPQSGFPQTGIDSTGPDFEPIAGVSLDQYAAVCKAVAAFNYDPAKLPEIAASRGIPALAWETASQGWNDRLKRNQALARRFNQLHRES